MKASDGTVFPYLVQRVDEREHHHESHKGVDRFFSFDYMGSSEFEFGALGKALKEMRSDISKWEPKQIKVGKHVAWYVGDPRMLVNATEFFTDQLSGMVARKIDTKERTHIRRTYHAVQLRPKNVSYDVHSGWWALDPALNDSYPLQFSPWILFKKKEHAEQWLKGLGGG